MSASASHLAGLPTETLEHVLLHLPGQDIIKMEVVNRHFRDLIRNSSALWHRRELFAAGLIDNPCNPCDLGRRRELREGYTHKWSKTASVVKSTHRSPPNQYSRWDRPRPIGRSTLITRPFASNSVSFISIPPVASQEPIDVWSIPSFPFNIFGSAVYHPENVLAVGECTGLLLRIHLLNLRDGSPYCAPPFNTITWAIPQGVRQITDGALAITGSRVMVYLYHSTMTRSSRSLWTVLAWDRKTGDLISDLPTMTWRGFSTSDAIFLDEFQIMVATHDAGTNAPELTVFNTLTPQDRPMSSRKFSLPSQYHDKNFFIHVDQDRSLGTLNSDGPLITDPTQAILVIEITKSSHRNALLVVRVQALIDQVCSARTDARIPWDEWGRGVVVMENSPSGLGQPIYVHGTHLVMVSRMPDRGGPMDCHRVRTFDFGRRGCGALPFSDEAGGAARKALFLDGNEFVFEVGGVGNVAMLGSVGNGNFFQISRNYPSSNVTLDVWELT